MTALRAPQSGRDLQHESTSRGASEEEPRSFVSTTAGTIAAAYSGIGSSLRAEPEAGSKTGGSVKRVNAGVLDVRI